MDTSLQKITGHEVVKLLRDVIALRLELRLANPIYSWRSVYCGEVGFLIDGWSLRFFNDCDSLDYCDSAESPDGRTGTFQSWHDAGEEPVWLLSDTEQQALEAMFDACT